MLGEKYGAKVKDELMRLVELTEGADMNDSPSAAVRRQQLTQSEANLITLLAAARVY